MDAIDRRQAKQRQQTLIAAGVVGAGLLALVSGTLGFVAGHYSRVGEGGGGTSSPGLIASVTGPSAGREGLTWSHPEMLAHLKSQGLDLVSAKTGYGFLNGPAVYAAPASTGWDDAAFAAVEKSSRRRLMLYIQICKTAQSAKDDAGLQGQKAFSWGRFLFECDDTKLLESAKSRLP